MYALLELALSTVSAVILKWKRLGATTAQLQSGRPHKLTECWSVWRVKIACPRLQNSLLSSKLPLEATSAQYREFHEMGFHGWAASLNPKITMRNARAGTVNADSLWVRVDSHWLAVQQSYCSGIEAVLEPENSPWLGWLKSLAIFWAFHRHAWYKCPGWLVALAQWCTWAVRTTLSRALRSRVVKLLFQAVIQLVKMLTIVQL
jgi:hypothetical protein